MPDQQGRWTADENKFLAAWVSENLGTFRCPVSGSIKWTVTAHAVTSGGLVSGQGEGIVLGGPIYPMVTVTCNHCGYNLYFNALVVGVIAKSRPFLYPSSTNN